MLTYWPGTLAKFVLLGKYFCARQSMQYFFSACSANISENALFPFHHCWHSRATSPTDMTECYNLTNNNTQDTTSIFLLRLYCFCLARNEINLLKYLVCQNDRHCFWPKYQTVYHHYSQSYFSTVPVPVTAP